MARFSLSGAIVSDDGHWWWSGSAWKALSRRASTEPGLEETAAARARAAKSKLAPADLQRRGLALAHKAPEREATRSAVYQRMRSRWPLPAHIEEVPLPGGFSLAEDEFLIGTAKEWGLSAQNLALTTQRLICPSDPSDIAQRNLPLEEIRDITLRKRHLGYQTLTVETDSGNRYMFPAHAGGKKVRDAILSMVTFAGGAAGGKQPASVPSDKYDQLRKIGQLKASGVLSEAEFEAEKSKLLGKQP